MWAMPQVPRPPQRLAGSLVRRLVPLELAQRQGQVLAQVQQLPRLALALQLPPLVQGFPWGSQLADR
jgi:hypothetical protein